METHVTEQPVLGEVHQHVLAALNSHFLFTETERLQANHFAHECEDLTRLTHCKASIRAGIAHREANVARQRCCHTTHNVLLHLSATPFRGHCPRSCHPFLTWVLGVPLPDRTDRRAGTFNRLAAARFQPADSWTLATLLPR